MSRQAQKARIDDLRREIKDHLQCIESRILALGESDEAEAIRIANAARDFAGLLVEPSRAIAPEHITPVVHPRADQERRNDPELERVTLALRRSNEDLRRFAFAASHDLQAPIRTVNTYLQFLERRLSDRLRPEEREMIGFVQTAARRMHTLILDLLLYWRASTEPFNYEPVDTEKILGVLKKTLQLPIGEAEAEVTWDSPLPSLWIDSAAMSQVLQNLVGNAIKYRRNEPPCVHISVAKEPDHWRVCVRDNGQGISPEHTTRIFEMLQRLHGEELPGSGIGLAICQRLVDRLGGKIWVDSEVGRGSTFCFTVPFPPIVLSPG